MRKIGMPMGPFEVTDYTGVDVTWHACSITPTPCTGTQPGRCVEEKIRSAFWEKVGQGILRLVQRKALDRPEQDKRRKSTWAILSPSRSTRRRSWWRWERADWAISTGPSSTAPEICSACSPWRGACSPRTSRRDSKASRKSTEKKSSGRRKAFERGRTCKTEAPVRAAGKRYAPVKISPSQ